MNRLTILAALLTGVGLVAASASAQEAAPLRSSPTRETIGAARRLPRQAPATASNLAVPATDFSQIQPVLPASTPSKGRSGGRRGGGLRLGP